nr:eukaryotic translation initiation factor 3 subunit j [Quercus suber]
MNSEYRPMDGWTVFEDAVLPPSLGPHSRSCNGGRPGGLRHRGWHPQTTSLFEKRISCGAVVTGDEAECESRARADESVAHGPRAWKSAVSCIVDPAIPDSSARLLRSDVWRQPDHNTRHPASNFAQTISSACPAHVCRDPFLTPSTTSPTAITTYRPVHESVANMAPSKATSSWDEESDSTPPSSPPVIARRPGKFDDEEADEEILDDWMDQEDSEVEREKAKKAAEEKAKAEAEAKANKKTKTQRIEEKRQMALRRKLEEEGEDSSDEEEDEADRRARLRASEKAADLKNAEDLFGSGSTVGMLSNNRGEKKVTVVEGNNPSDAIDLSAMKLFNPAGVAGFQKLRETLMPLLLNNAKKAGYPSFAQEFAKQMSKDLTSDQIKKVASGLTALSNEKMREEKAAEKGGKKTKAAKSKVTLNASRDVSRAADTMAYDDDGLDDGDFM